MLDLDHLKDITLDDDELMREVVSALIDDTSRQLSLLDAAIRGQDRQRCMKLALDRPIFRHFSDVMMRSS